MRLLQLDENETDTNKLNKLMLLARAGLVSDEDIRLVKQSIEAMENDKVPTIAQREVLLHILSTLIDFVIEDRATFVRLKQKLDD